MVNHCKNLCKNHESGIRSRVYYDGGCYCRVCEYYFQDKLLRCPCCNTSTRFKSRSNRRLAEEPTRVT